MYLQYNKIINLNIAVRKVTGAVFIQVKSYPIGTGATCSYSSLDLQIYNGTNSDFQLIVYLTKENLEGELRSSEPSYTSFTYLEFVPPDFVAEMKKILPDGYKNVCKVIKSCIDYNAKKQANLNINLLLVMFTYYLY